MEITEIMKDALVYPLTNIKALVIYIILGIILGAVVIGTNVGVAAMNNTLAGIGTGIVGIIIYITLNIN